MAAEAVIEEVDCNEVDKGGITMLDVLQEEKDLEDDAKAVLGGSDDKNCTYSAGYIKRQALYACLTCIPAENREVGGICLACSLTCHERHNLVELYTKRKFRCDCGNNRFGGNKCSLEPKKDQANELNVYNHNFRGLYCSCNRPYPDPEEATQDEMIQCIVCEDWFHGKHLDCKIPPADDYAEMICSACTSRHQFFKFYSTLTASNTIEPSNGSQIGGGDGTLANDSSNCQVCKIKCPPPIDVPGTLFLVEGWRKHLCQCQDCQTNYALGDVTFLMDPEDTVQSYEDRGKVLDVDGPESQYEQGMKALSQMDRVMQVEAISGYNHMKQQLMDYLKKFVDNKKVVREEDIREFFDGMRAQKKPRIEPPHFCH